MPFDHRDYVKPFGKHIAEKPFYGYNNEAEMLQHVPAQYHDEIRSKAVQKDGYMRAELDNMIVAY